ncbi:MAG TPA: Fmu (Sun) domain-containing protein, partial [Chitinophagaceae bacterium]
LINLKKRFANAGIKRYKSFVADLTRPISHVAPKTFDLIVCDAPCTGSGTWSRTPEQVYFFETERIEKFSALQGQIVSNVIPYLKENGFLLYITCSVFKKENEDVINYVQEKFDLEFTQMNVLKGYDKKADTMFVTLMKKKL